MNKSLGGGPSRHLAHVGGCHRCVQVFRPTADEDGEEISAESFVGGAGAADGVSEPRFDLEKVRQKFVDAESVEDCLDGLCMAAQRNQRIRGVAAESCRAEQESCPNFLVVFRQLRQKNEVLSCGHRVADEVELIVAGFLKYVVDCGWVVIASRFVKAGKIQNYVFINIGAMLIDEIKQRILANVLRKVYMGETI